jgi:uncharacterized protein (TIGR03905 family)
MRYDYKTKSVCATNISFDLNGDKVSNVTFTNGCNGNLKAISKLVDGMTVDEIESKLKGNICGAKNTSCADQLAIAVREAYNNVKG